jgi:hypothetical protein
MQKNTWFYSSILAAITVNTVVICMLTFWTIDDRHTLKVVQVEVQELKHRIEMEIKLRQEIMPEIKKSAEMLSRNNPDLDPYTALLYAIKIWQCSDDIVPNDLLTALIVVESGADQKAVSPQGALGLMQIMPAHWSYASKELRNPFTNIEAGATILRQYIKRHGLMRGLQAYNSGSPSQSSAGASLEYAKKVLQTAQNQF